ncbi:MAG: hypothetical protein ABIF10_04090 [Candidatus Woesearchaeota archaeon]
MALNLKSQLQYERTFCDLMFSKGHHTERVAASGRRKNSICDAVCFTSYAQYICEIKATKQARFVYIDEKGMAETAARLNIKALLAVYFKSSHSSAGKGRWVFRTINEGRMVVRKDDKSEDI